MAFRSVYDPVPLATRRPARRPRLLALVAAFLVVVAFVTGQLTSARGWLMVALAWVLVVALAGHRDAGGGHLLRMLGEYAVIAVLVVLLVTGTGIAKPTAPPPGTHHRRCRPALPGRRPGPRRERLRRPRQPLAHRQASQGAHLYPAHHHAEKPPLNRSELPTNRRAPLGAPPSPAPPTRRCRS